MSASRKSSRKGNGPKHGKRQARAEGFQDRLLVMLEWLADKDPVRAARLIGDYLDDLAEEITSPPKPAKS